MRNKPSKEPYIITFEKGGVRHTVTMENEYLNQVCAVITRNRNNGYTLIECIHGTKKLYTNLYGLPNPSFRRNE